MHWLTKFVTLPIVTIGAVLAVAVVAVDAPSAERAQDPTAGPRGACGYFIRESMNNPASYEAVNSLNWPTNFRDDGIITVGATYRAANAFGGVVSQTTYCDITLDDGDYRLQALR